MVSQMERERRYAALRSVMSLHALDLIVVCGRDDDGASAAGRLQYVTDMKFIGGRSYALIPLEGAASVIQPGNVGRGIAEAAGWIEDVQVAIDQPAAIAHGIRERGYGASRVGIVGLGTLMGVDHYHSIRTQLPSCEFVDATVQFDSVKIVKSPEEITYLEETSDVIRRTFDAVAPLIRPGISERVLIADLIRILRSLGGTAGFVNIARSGGIGSFHPARPDLLEERDMIGIDIQYRGPRGYAAEVTRYFSFCEPSARVASRFEAGLEAFERIKQSARSGSSTAGLIDVIAEAVQPFGFSVAGPVGRGPVHMQVHGIGLDFSEPPIIPGVDLELREGMVLSVHPRIAPEDLGLLEVTVEDNIEVTADGARSMTIPTIEWTVL